jgi:hypothetical protein
MILYYFYYALGNFITAKRYKTCNYLFFSATAGIVVALVLLSRIMSDGGGVGFAVLCCCFAMVFRFNI